MAEPKGWDASSDVDSGAATSSPAALSASSYSDYLRLPALLTLQKPLARPLVPDEMLFIIVHQAHELWFKEMLSELHVLGSDVDARRFTSGVRTLARLTAIVHLLGEHMGVLATMPAHEFQRFRSVLGTSSGLESEQFRRMERLVGLGALALAPHALALAPRADVEGGIEAAPSRSGSIREAFWRAVASDRPSVGALVSAAELDPLALGRAFVTAFEEPALAPQRGLGEAMLVFDEEMVAWRRRHFEVALGMLGKSAGTGGSSGATYLRATMERRFFPELWHWRDARGADAG